MHLACLFNKTCNQYVKYLMTIYVSMVSPQPNYNEQMQTA